MIHCSFEEVSASTLSSIAVGKIARHHDAGFCGGYDNFWIGGWTKF
jgi:hypothetical protein